MFVYKLFDKRDDFPFFIVCMLKSICYCALVGEFLRVAHSSLLYNNFNEEAMKLLNRMKTQGTQSLTCRKALSKIFLLYIFLTHDTMSVVFPFCSFLIFIFTFIFFNFLCIYFLYPFVCLFFRCDTLPAVFLFFDTWTFPSSFFFSLIHDTLSVVFCPICYVCNVLLKRCEMFVVFIMFYF